MLYPTTQLFAVVALAGTSIKGFDSVSLAYSTHPPTPPEGYVVESSAARRGLAPMWLDHIPKYVCDHAEVSVELSEPSEFGPRWLTVQVTNYTGGLADGTCLVDTRRGPKVIHYALTPAVAEGSRQ
jgi:hypothetical protein